jgi:signal transduction histidine kinase
VAGDLSVLKVLAAALEHPSPDAGLSELVKNIGLALGASHAYIGLIDEESGDLVLQYGYGLAWPREMGEPIVIPHAQGIVGIVAQEGKSIVTPNVSDDPRYRELFAGTTSEIASPIRDESVQIVGVFNLEWNSPDTFPAGEVEVVEAAAAVASSLLVRIGQLRREEALMRIGSTLDTVMNESDLIAQVIQTAEETLRLHSCSVFLLEPGTERLVLRGTIGELKDYVNEISYELGEGFTGWVAQNAQPILLQDPQSDPRWRGKYVEIPSSEISSFLAVPIAFGDETYGVIRVLRRRNMVRQIQNHFTARDEKLLYAIAEQVGSGLTNIRNMAGALRNERMIAWGELSAKSSHMIGNRVFAIKGDVNELKFLAEDEPLDRDAIKHLQSSLAVNVLRIEEILNDFRDFVTATQIRKAPIDLNQLVRETVEEVFPKRSDSELILELNPLPLVPADERRVRRAVSELIENSLHFIEHGRLTIQTQLLASGRFAQIVVEDNGPGIESERKETVFQPFFSGRSRSMGLGLSIVKGIMEAHGGDAYEDGHVGQGARFVLVLPT